jgi:acetyl-CoA synthetase
MAWSRWCAPRVTPDDALLDRLGYTPRDAEGRRRIAIPPRANICTDTLGLHAGSDALAVRFEDAAGVTAEISFRELDVAVRRCAAWFARLGVARGGRVAIHSGPRIETVIAHLATFRLGAIATTLSQLYGAETLRHALTDSGAVLLVTQDSVWRPHAALRADCPALRAVLVVGEAGPGELPFDSWRAVPPQPGPCVDTAAEDPALLVYTSGSTGLPKGVLHAHRILHAYRPTLELFYDLSLDAPGTVLWTNADWGWIAALLDTVYLALQLGRPLIATQRRFDPEDAIATMARHRVTHALLLPTALNRLATIAAPRARHDLALRCVFTGGEPLPASTIAWVEQELGCVLNEGYGMSEVNHMIGNCAALRPIRPGSMGWEFPGHVAALVDEAGEPVPDGEVGEIVTTPEAPTAFLGYWGKSELTLAMRLGPWLRTGDLAMRDADGYFWYRGRGDDLIKSGGYRIGPTEIEEVLIADPAVQEAAAIGVRDPMRGQVILAVLRLADGVALSPALEERLRGACRARLGPFKVPHRFAVVAAMPTTSSGKISRRLLREAFSTR